jgi:hypothetical protein
MLLNATGRFKCFKGNIKTVTSGQYIWDLWLTQLLLDRFVYEKSRFPLTVLFTHAPKFIPSRPNNTEWHLQWTGWLNNNIKKFAKPTGMFSFFLFIWHVSCTAYVWNVECVHWCQRTLLRFDKLLLPMSVSSKCHILKQIDCFNFIILTHLRFRDSRWSHVAADRTMNLQAIDVIISELVTTPIVL